MTKIVYKKILPDKALKAKSVESSDKITVKRIESKKVNNGGSGQ